ncbi:hypothetical protein NOCA2220215 [metagenome]|uniref:Uncharacterized protein n=1 Tax=metagenome TaxID=256318 RepID=A0A2P2BZ68_9ZZZZ
MGATPVAAASPLRLRPVALTRGPPRLRPPPHSPPRRAAAAGRPIRGAHPAWVPTNPRSDPTEYTLTIPARAGL